MANEKRLIRLEEAKKLFDDIPPFIGMTGRCVQDMLDKSPTVDAVEVVRCKDCKSFGIYECSGNGYCKHDNGIADPEPNAFCSYGERRTDNA